jgi:hypothetical protein
MLQIEYREIGGLLNSDFDKLCGGRRADSPDFIDRHNRQQIGLHLSKRQTGNAPIMQTLLCDEVDRA